MLMYMKKSRLIFVGYRKFFGLKNSTAPLSRQTAREVKRITVNREPCNRPKGPDIFPLT